MADIKQAAKWMRDESRARRKSEPLEVFHSSEHFDGCVMMSRCDSIANFARIGVAELLAEDWEIAE
jgi:hypothetical protein